MKHVFYLLSILLMTTTGYAQDYDWQVVGTEAFPPTNTTSPSLTFHPTTHQPYVACGLDQNQTGVMAYNGTTWNLVGSQSVSSGGTYGYPIIRFHPTTHELYIAYSSGYKLNVQRFDGTNWLLVGSPNFSAGVADFKSFEFHPSTHEPYIAYQDGGNDNRVTVHRYDGTNWVTVGPAGFSAENSTRPSLAFHPTTHEPYVAYGHPDHCFYLEHYDGTNWIAVTDSTRNDDCTVYKRGLAFHPTTHEPYVVFHQMLIGDWNYSRLTRFDGENWIPVGPSDGYVSTQGFGHDLLFHPTTHEPYIAYHVGFGYLQRYDGENWYRVGGGHSYYEGPSPYQNFKFHPTTHEPYVAFQDVENGNGATVVRYTNMTSVHSKPSGPMLATELVPNVIHQNQRAAIQLTTETQQDVTIQVMDMQGSVVLNFATLVTVGSQQIDLPTMNLNNGLYLVSVIYEQGIETMKLIVVE